MGINANVLRFMLLAKSKGASFDRVAMIGRQGLHLSPKLLKQILNDEFSAGLTDREIEEIHQHKYAEKLFEWMGARQVDSFDFSGYENATFVHDFNQEIDDRFKEKYDCVIDGGTLEHIFHFPQALKNCMEMVREGGSFYGVAAANNEMGHGFYQISPELYYRTLSPENGYSVNEMYLHEGRETRKWFTVADPNAIRRRVTLVNTVPSLIVVRATRKSVAPIFARPPLQADYVDAWKEDANLIWGAGTSITKSRLRTLRRILPKTIRHQLGAARFAMRDRLGRLSILAGLGHDSLALARFDPVTALKQARERRS